MASEHEVQIQLLQQQIAALNERSEALARELAAAERARLADEAAKPSSLDEFLLLRIAEDEAIAVAAQSGPWSFVPDSSGDGIFGPSHNVVDPGGYNGRYGATILPQDGEHIVRWEPARVLSDCEAKRTIVEHYQYLRDDYLDEEGPDAPSVDVELEQLRWVLRVLARPYIGHPDFRDEWQF
ncbi:DUF6221 family protein [Geodermatophilus sp. DSM 44513]|uniref:DUF6221 family protein n=1 Tax=Geodermatophilus sp. DSM 44513 TaxID=1528104 RepID=UPI001278DB9B|nr:DUF6221 family protein [Geodermatophilus sp. DSM 44513]WNV77532.1 DUF6221 family protein [Geodermatophilus sp. DSM 44513]